MAELQRFDLKLLYVEDEEAAREEVQTLLRRWVREVLTARDGHEGLELFRQQAPDLVVTDLRMPVMSGLDMARAIRKLDPEARIIVTTAHSDTSFFLEAIDLGVDHYVMKPIDLERLVFSVRRCAEAIEARRSEKRHAEERERLLAELQEAMTKVKQLSGLLPICASCKKIRDESGGWQAIEMYVRDHSEAQFSHSLCPGCMAKLYPEEYTELKRKGLVP